MVSVAELGSELCRFNEKAFIAYCDIVPVPGTSKHYFLPY